MDAAADPDDRLLSPYRVMRSLAGGDDSPWPGTLVRTPDGTSLVLVEAAPLGAGWRGWDADEAGHVLAPVDVVRRSRGHAVALPVCVERVDAFLRRRAGAGAALSDGEAVTLAVSLVRGFTELCGAADDARGSWWVTDAGRPVFACDAGAESIRDATETLLRALSSSGLGAELADAVAAVRAARPSRYDLEDCERALFAAVGAEPLSLTVFGPRAARQSEPREAAVSASSRAARGLPAVSAEGPRGLLGALVRHVDTDLSDLMSRATTDVWRRLRAARSAGGRRPWLVAAGLAVVIVVGGMLWPTGERAATAEMPEPAAASTATPAAGAAPSADATPAGDAEGDGAVDASSTGGEARPPAGAVDYAAVVDDLLEQRAACAGEAECLMRVVEGGAITASGGVVDLPPGERTSTVVDEYGGVAVVRVDANRADTGSQLVVVVRSAESWLIRDVYPVQND